MKKIRIYIVDDEWMAIEYLKALLKEASPAYEIVGEAFQGAYAYEEILSVKPDLVFVDIQMPAMNGLELAEKLLSRDARLPIIFLTSYRDFDYVKKGMELGIASYMLKNELSVQGLRTEITKIMDTVAVEKKKAHTYTEYNLKKFLFSACGPQELKIEKQGSLQRFALIMFVADIPLYLDERRPLSYRYDAMFLEELIYPRGLTCRNVVQIENGQWCAIFYIDATVSDSRELLKDAGEKIQAVLSDADISASFLLETPVREFFQIQEIFQRMNLVKDYLYFYGRRQCLYLEELERRKAQNPETDIHIAAFCYTLDEEDHIASIYALEQLFTFAEKYYSFREYRRVVQDIKGILKRYFERKKLELPMIIDKSEFHSCQEVTDWFSQIINEMYEQLSRQKENSFSAAVEIAIEYIHKNYSDNISVQDIAAAAGISDGHLRKCFKNETDETVVDYLTAYRIKKAKELMKRRDLRISEIYERVGFTSSQYFSYVFKKIEGKTPSEYMKSM